MIREVICTYEVAKLAKEKGFPQAPKENNYCDMYCWDGLRNIHLRNNWAVWYMEEYDHENLYAAPTQSLLQRWLREEKGIHISVEYEWVEGIEDWTFYAYIKKVNNAKVVDDAIKSGFNTYELALEDALKYALENLV